MRKPSTDSEKESLTSSKNASCSDVVFQRENVSTEKSLCGREVKFDESAKEAVQLTHSQSPGEKGLFLMACIMLNVIIHLTNSFIDFFLH